MNNREMNDRKKSKIFWQIIILVKYFCAATYVVVIVIAPMQHNICPNSAFVYTWYTKKTNKST